MQAEAQQDDPERHGGDDQRREAGRARRARRRRAPRSRPEGGSRRATQERSARREARSVPPRAATIAAMIAPAAMKRVDAASSGGIVSPVDRDRRGTSSPRSCRRPRAPSTPSPCGSPKQRQRRARAEQDDPERGAATRCRSGRRRTGRKRSMTAPITSWPAIRIPIVAVAPIRGWANVIVKTTSRPIRPPDPHPRVARRTRSPRPPVPCRETRRIVTASRSCTPVANVERLDARRPGRRSGPSPRPAPSRRGRRAPPALPRGRSQAEARRTWLASGSSFGSRAGR